LCWLKVFDFFQGRCDVLSRKKEVWLGLVLASLALAACSSGAKPDLEPSDQMATVEPTEPIVQEPLEPLPSGPMSAAVITKTLSEKTFRYSGAGRNGTITFYGDGTTKYDEAGKGEGTGIWQASDGKLCEARDPTSFLPKGTPSTCQKISSDGAVITAGRIQYQRSVE
jgi:hypothetical protein